MRINYNVSAMLANNALANSDSLLAKSLERLSSGLKINHAKDNPAGLAMAKRMNAQLEGLSVASQNASDGISVIEIADGAMTEVTEMLQRMNELSVKAANGTMTDEDRSVIQDEVAQLKEEITRISETVEFNGQKLLNGEFDLKGYTTAVDVKVQSYSSDVPTKQYTVDTLTLSKEIAADGTETGNYLVDQLTFAADGGFPEGAKYTVKDNLITIDDGSGFEMTLDISGVDFGAGNTVTYSAANNNQLVVDATGIGAMRLQIGANEGQIMEIGIPAISLRNMGIENIDLGTVEGARDAMTRLDGAIKFVSSVRGRLGAYQNRLESSINSLDITSENMTSAYSRIMDVDMAEEMTNYTTYQVLTQAGTSMLAQANERPSQVLQLLQ